MLTRRDDPGTPGRPAPAGVTVRHVTAGPRASHPQGRDRRTHPRVGAASSELAGRATRCRPRALLDVGPRGRDRAARPRHPAGADLPRARLREAPPPGCGRHEPAARIPTERLLARRADRILATCEDELSELIRMGAHRGRVSIVPCGVDADEFSPYGPAVPRGARPRLVSIGRLVRRKGVDELVAALARVPDAELLVAGGPAAAAPPTPTPPAAALGRPLRGGRPREDARRGAPRAGAPLLRSADAVVCAPWYEPFGIVALEAMACERAVVATEVGGLQDTVVHGVTGLHVPPRRPDALAAALRDAVRSDAARGVRRRGAPPGPPTPGRTSPPPPNGSTRTARRARRDSSARAAGGAR